MAALALLAALACGVPAWSPSQASGDPAESAPPPSQAPAKAGGAAERLERAMAALDEQAERHHREMMLVFLIPPTFWLAVMVALSWLLEREDRRWEDERRSRRKRKAKRKVKRRAAEAAAGAPA